MLYCVPGTHTSFFVPSVGTRSAALRFGSLGPVLILPTATPTAIPHPFGFGFRRGALSAPRTTILLLGTEGVIMHEHARETAPRKSLHFMLFCSSSRLGSNCSGVSFLQTPWSHQVLLRGRTTASTVISFNSLRCSVFQTKSQASNGRGAPRKHSSPTGAAYTEEGKPEDK